MGCASTRTVTDTPRSSTEQLLVSEAIERALEGLDWPTLEGVAVAVEVLALGEADAPYLQAAAEARVRSLGARVTAREDAEMVLGLRAGVLGTTSQHSSFGVPSIPLLVGATPQLDLVRVLRRSGYAKLRLLAWDATGAAMAASPPASAHTRSDIVSVLFLVFHRGNVDPEGDGEVDVD
ncbi:MAG TPA: hypothetical protein VMS76_11320 [Planctomycetota bacterium]|nr:hypothetical protein [Planctomycetota bacterium]